MPTPKNPMHPPIVSRKPSVKKRHGGLLRRAMLAFGLACLAVLTYAIVARAARPLILIHTEGTEITSLKKNLDAEKARNKDLKSRIEYLRTPEGAQAEARKFGWVKKGEVTFQLNDPPKPAEIAKEKKGVVGTVKGWLGGH